MSNEQASMDEHESSLGVGGITEITANDIGPVFGSNVIGKLALSPKLIGDVVKFFIPETSRKTTNVMEIVAAGPQARGLTPGMKVLIENDKGTSFGKDLFLIGAEHILGRIE